MRVVLRAVVPVAIVSSGLAAVAAVLVGVGLAVHSAATVNAILGGILIAAFPLNVFTLTIIARAAVNAGAGDRTMDERFQQFIVTTMAAALFCVIGIHELHPFLPLGLGDVLLVLAVLIGTVAKPIIFIRKFGLLR